MILKSAPLNPIGGYEWISCSWQPYVECVNLLNDNLEGLNRIEFVLATSYQLDSFEFQSNLAQMQTELGVPIFIGTFRDRGFPEDEFAMDAAVWNVSSRQVMLLRRQFDRETPCELVIVVIVCTGAGDTQLSLAARHPT